MKSSVKFQLMSMMFLMFFGWGAWYGQMSKYLLDNLHATGDQVGNAYTTFAIASIFAPFFVGLISDRFFAAQKVMGFLNILGGVILYFLSLERDPEAFFWYILAYTLCFAPNLALSNSIAMNQMSNPEKEFPSIRVTGTIAWIVVTNIIGFYALGDKVAIFEIAMYTSFLLGIYSFTLPNTPPKADKNASVAQILGLDALKLFKDRSFLIFFISSILICIPLSFYYAMANPSLTDAHMSNVENKMSLGQASEVIFMLLIPIAFTRLGVKKMLVVGLVAWIIRFLCFGYGDGISSEWILYIGIILHGVCYDFFFVTGQIYTDQKAGEKIKNSAQGLITFATYGIGMGIGSKLSGIVLDYYTVNEVKDWQAVWMVPAAIAGVVLLLFVFFFSESKSKPTYS
ncbi:nucleoside permease [Aquirufa antheringensis]|jgi:nucleoside transporter|uniref:nucleoside permease n=1 Tax=Aquirufa antheringensis TaxID=2516559 RepID=UPI0022A8A7C0|nr:nucleoside permease [Aquirufa antheringensis]MCZ2487679.1 nucleoside permease [Aquirufa antheringensis]MCZ2489496.1 nucleoside permease [Aquirufa antheringensis]